MTAWRRTRILAILLQSSLVLFPPACCRCLALVAKEESCNGDDDNAPSGVSLRGSSGGASPTAAASTGADQDGGCRDVVNNCAWLLRKDADEQQQQPSTAVSCIERFGYMREHCAATCQICHVDDPPLASLFDATTRHEVPRLFHDVPQVITGFEALTTWLKLRETEDYMYETVYRDPAYAKVRTTCRNRHEHCTFWAAIGECETKAGYMHQKCAPACQTCRQLDYAYRCPASQWRKNPHQPGALSQPENALHALFTRMVTAWSRHVTVLSRPTTVHVDDAPWIVQLDDFLTVDECTTLVRLGRERGYRPSTEVTSTAAEGPSGRPVRSAGSSSRRTSSNTWCKDACAAHPVTVAVHERLERLLDGIPSVNFEYLQLLYYRSGEYYVRHGDYQEQEGHKPQGVRMLTVYVYLNNVTAGGGTRFPDLNVTVMPRQGRVLVWPSVLNGNTTAEDVRTFHEALPVQEGVKYGANAWVHQRDFKTPFAAGCH